MKRLLTGLALLLTACTNNAERPVYYEYYASDLVIRRVLSDFNKNGVLDLGDKAGFVYDLNNDGNADAYSTHWVRGVTVNGVDYNPMPHEFSVDKDYDGTLDVRYRGFDERGIPSIVESYAQPLPNVFAEGESGG